MFIMLEVTEPVQTFIKSVWCFSCVQQSFGMPDEGVVMEAESGRDANHTMTGDEMPIAAFDTDTLTVAVLDSDSVSHKL